MMTNRMDRAHGAGNIAARTIAIRHRNKTRADAPSLHGNKWRATARAGRVPCGAAALQPFDSQGFSVWSMMCRS
jgi:hypothetical protein